MMIKTPALSGAAQLRVPARHPHEAGKSRQLCFSPACKLIWCDQLNLALVNLPGTTFGHVEPKRLGFPLGPVIQAFEKTMVVALMPAVYHPVRSGQ
jgi:hypothetical protein